MGFVNLKNQSHQFNTLRVMHSTGIAKRVSTSQSSEFRSKEHFIDSEGCASSRHERAGLNGRPLLVRQESGDFLFDHEVVQGAAHHLVWWVRKHRAGPRHPREKFSLSNMHGAALVGKLHETVVTVVGARATPTHPTKG